MTYIIGQGTGVSGSAHSLIIKPLSTLPNVNDAFNVFSKSRDIIDA